MKEVEVKFLEIDVNQMTKHLESLGAKKAFEGKLHARYFNPKKEKTTLRIRTEGDKHVLAYKEKETINGIKEKEETEIEVEDANTLAKIFENLGFKQFTEIQKHRVSYKYKDWSFEFDTMPDIPPFLEIEGNSQEHVQEAIALLRLNPQDAKPWSGKEVIEHYSKLQ